MLIINAKVLCRNAKVFSGNCLNLHVCLTATIIQLIGYSVTLPMSHVEGQDCLYTMYEANASPHNSF